MSAQYVPNGNDVAQIVDQGVNELSIVQFGHSSVTLSDLFGETIADTTAPLGTGVNLSDNANITIDTYGPTLQENH